MMTCLWMATYAEQQTRNRGSRLQANTAEEKQGSQMERGRRQTEMMMSRAKSGPELSAKQMAVIVYREGEREKQNQASKGLFFFVSV